MDYRSLYARTVVDLKKLAKEMGVKVPAGTTKVHLVEMLLAANSAPAVSENIPENKTESPAPRRRGRPPKAVPAPEVEEKDEKGETEKIILKQAPEALEIQPEAPSEPAKEPEARPQHNPNPLESHSRPRLQPATRHISTGVSERRPAHEYIGRDERRSNPSGPSAENKTENISDGARRTPARSAQEYFRSDERRNYVPNQFRPRENYARPYQNAEKAPSNHERPAGDAERPRRESVHIPEYGVINPGAGELLAAGDCADGHGMLEIHPEGYGFLRAENYLPGPNDVYVSIAQIRRFNLRTGDYVEGKTRPQREGDRYTAMLYITGINGLSPEQNARRRSFESLVPVYPDSRIHLESKAGASDPALRLMDMLAPIGKGQRGMIVSPPKAGKTTFLKKLANAITENHPETHLIVLLIDERPEEVTDMQRSIKGEVVYSTFDEAPENHTRVSEMVLGRAQRLVEMGKDVVILLDSITRLARAYNLVIPPTGRSLSGGLDPGALHKPKRFFGAARNIENGGSLTIIATALVETGSRMDDIIYEEFKGTGNMELHLDRKLSDRRIFPAIDMIKSGTRREELLLTPREMEGEYQIRRMLGNGGNQETVEQLMSMVEKTRTNEEFFSRLRGWSAAFEKEGFTLTPSKR